MNNSIASRSLLRLIVVIAAAWISAANPLAGQNATAVPANLRPPAGNEAFLKVAATGTQNYICLPAGWTFIGPQATLFVTLPWFNTTFQQQVGTHFLTPNPAEPGTNRPLWQSSVDSSIVWARQLEAAEVDASAIPWLLLQASGHQHGPSGGSTLNHTTYIQRVNTTGGLRPSGACTVGERQFVPYTADYVFYRKARN